MSRYLYTLILVLFLVVAGRAQEQEVGGQAGEAASPEAEAAAADEADDTDAPDDEEVEEEVDDSDLDLQTYEEDDDVFVPTEEIPADEPIPFPSNI